MKTIKKHLKTVLILSLTAGLFFSCNNPAAPVAPVAPGETATYPYNEPTLPEGTGTDPFKGHAYRINYSQIYSEYAFGNDNILTDSSVSNGTQTNGKKYQYSYNANTKELNLKAIQIYSLNLKNDAYNWYTYSQYVALYKSFTYSDYPSYLQRHSNAGQTTMTETEFNQYIQGNIGGSKEMFEKIIVYKAEEDSSQNLKLRTNNYYKSAPSQIPCAYEEFSFMYESGSNTCSVRINPSAYYSLSGKGTIIKSTTNFAITNITANTITAVQATMSATGYTPVSGGQQLQMSYTLTLGNDNNLIMTLTGADTTTNTWFTSQFSSTSLTLSTSTGYMTYTKQ